MQELLDEIRALQPGTSTPCQSSSSDSSQDLQPAQYAMPARTHPQHQPDQQQLPQISKLQEQHEPSQSGVKEHDEIQPVHASGSLQLPEHTSQHDTGWFAQSQKWAATLYNNEVNTVAHTPSCSGCMPRQGADTYQHPAVSADVTLTCTLLHVTQSVLDP